MAKVTQTYKLIKDIIDQIDLTFTISSIEEITPYSADTLGVYKIYSCNTLWATKGFTITIDEADYEITEIDVNESITVTGVLLPTASSFSIYPPKFLHGTVIASVAEFDQQKINNDKLPMVWLHQMTKDKFDRSSDSPIERESDCELFFLVDSNFTGWSTEDHCLKAIEPMRNLLNSFFEALENSSLVGSLEEVEYTTMDHANFGVYVAQKGHVNNIFNAYLSGVQLNITIPFLTQDSPCCSN